MVIVIKGLLGKSGIKTFPKIVTMPKIFALDLIVFNQTFYQLTCIYNTFLLLLENSMRLGTLFGVFQLHKPTMLVENSNHHNLRPSGEEQGVATAST